MKRIKSLLSLLLAVALVLGVLPALRTPASAADYGLTVCGVPVTEENAGDILGNGMFAYEPGLKTLFLLGGAYDFTPKSEDEYLIHNRSIYDLTISVWKATTLSTTGTYSFRLGANTKITGDGDLTLDKGMFVDSNVRLTFTKGYTAIYDSDCAVTCGGGAAKLVVIDATLYAYAGIDTFDSGIYLYDADVVAPTGAVVRDDRITDADGNPAQKLLIQGRTPYYQLVVGGVRVYDWNKDDILGTGDASYVSENKTLYITGEMAYGDGPMVESHENGLTIRPFNKAHLGVVGVNNSVFDLSGDTTILGNYQLELWSGEGNAITMRGGADLTISTASVEIGGFFGIAGSEGSKLTIRGSDLDIDVDRAAIVGFTEGVFLADTKLVGPEGVKYSNGEFRCKDNTISDELHFENNAPFFDLEIDGIPVTYGNKDDVLNNGVFRYDLNNNALHINGDYTCLGTMIENKSPDLWIFADKNSVLTSRAGEVISSWKSFQIGGNYRLTCCGAPDSPAIWLRTYETEAQCLWIFNPRLVCWGIRGMAYPGGTAPELEIEDCELTSTLYLDRAISGFGEITLKDCYIAVPKGGRIENGAIVAADGGKADQVFIGRGEAPAEPDKEYALTIDHVPVTDKNRNDVLGNGVFRYNPDSNILSINGDYTCVADMIDSEIDDLRIVLTDDCNLLSLGGATIVARASLSVDGDNHTLRCGDGSAAISVRATNVGVLLFDLDLYVDHVVRGIDGYGEGCWLEIRDCKIVMNGVEQSAINLFSGGVTLRGCKVAYPEDAQPMNLGICTPDGKAVTGMLRIERDPTANAPYDLWIGGEQVTSSNCGDVLGDGNFIYDPDEGILYVWNGCASPSEPCIRSGVDGLNVYFVGPVTLESGADAVIELTANAKLKGYDYIDSYTGISKAPALTLKGSGAGIRADCGRLEIYTISIDVQTPAKGVAGPCKQLYLNAVDMTCGTVEGVDALTLHNCAVVAPPDAALLDGAIRDKAGEIAAHVEISAEGAGSPLPCTDATNCPGRIFKDMPEKGNWAHDAIDWAVYYGVTAGTSANTFSPNQGCTRAQVVTFLWRAAGQPEPSGSDNPFKDVPSDAYYYKAVLWAVEHNVTAGTSATTFSPNSTCTRAQIVTFLWRYAGEPAPKTANNPFKDVSADAYYYKAVLWASETGVTTGTSATTFSPSSTCTRAQVVAFLYREIA